MAAQEEGQWVIQAACRTALTRTRCSSRGRLRRGPRPSVPVARCVRSASPMPSTTVLTSVSGVVRPNGNAALCCGAGPRLPPGGGCLRKPALSMAEAHTRRMTCSPRLGVDALHPPGVVPGEFPRTWPAAGRAAGSRRPDLSRPVPAASVRTAAPRQPWGGADPRACSAAAEPPLPWAAVNPDRLRPYVPGPRPPVREGAGSQA